MDNGHTDDPLGDLTGWRRWHAGNRRWEQAAIHELGRRFTTEELTAVADGGVAERIMRSYWQDHDDGMELAEALERLVKRVKRWLGKRG